MEQVDQIEERLDELAGRTQNWDSYGSDPLQAGIADRVRGVLRLLETRPRLCLTSAGGVDVEWESDGQFLSICIEPNDVSAYIDGCDLTER